MNELSDLINSQGTVKPKIIIEIGSLHGKDMQTLSNLYSDVEVHIIEAHPEFSKKIKKDFPNFNVYNYGITNNDGKITFN